MSPDSSLIIAVDTFTPNLLLPNMLNTSKAVFKDTLAEGNPLNVSRLPL